MAILSKGITLEYKEKGGASATWNKVANIQEIPDLGGTAESVEVTTLSNKAHMYINGLESYSDSLDFTCLYVKGDVAGSGEDAGKGFTTISGICEDNKKYEWKVTIPAETGTSEETTCTFDAEPSVKINGVGTNAAVTYTLSLKPTSVMAFA